MSLLNLKGKILTTAIIKYRFIKFEKQHINYGNYKIRIY